ncbi:TIGR04222 domain-containing membrane protein [Streptomyces erythrochromogenes]|uniref:TIGR04222 domain-containing membrane protein n=1 Tax=Streptomyces erythrochromogenes TaxID=285574 RepID=UPI0038095596
MNILAVAIWIAVVVSSVLLVRGLRRARPGAAVASASLHDLSEAAFLVGGPGTVVDTALVSMLGDGRLVVGGPGIVRVRPGARAGDPAERAVLQAHAGAPSGWLYQVRYGAMCDPAVQEIGDALAARGLVAPPGSGRRWRRWGLIQAVACVVWLVASIPLTVVGYALDRDPGVPFIAMVAPVLLAGIVLGLLCMARAGNRVTRAGLRALLALRSAYVNDRTPHVQTALFGLRGLRDPFLRQQLVPAARGTRLAAAQSGARSHRPHTHSSSSDSSPELLPVMWCATSDGGGGGGSGCGSSGSSCGGGGGSGCSGSSGSGCGSSSSSSSSCSSGSSSSSCSSSSGSSCSSSS